MTISGVVEHQERHDEEDGTLLREERRTGRFKRVLTLPGPVDADRMTSEQRQGVLRIRLPKAA